MKTTTVSQLKTSLSAYLHQVKTCEEVLIAEHGRPIARLLPIANPVIPIRALARHGEEGPAQARRETPASGFLEPASSGRPPRGRAFENLR